MSFFFFSSVEPVGDAGEERYRLLSVSEIWPPDQHPYLETPSLPSSLPPFGSQKAFWMETIAGCALLFALFKLGCLAVNREAYMCISAIHETVIRAAKVWELLSAKIVWCKTSVLKLFRLLDAKTSLWTTVIFNAVFLVWTEISIGSVRRAVSFATLETVCEQSSWNTSE